MKIKDLDSFFSCNFCDCFQAANYIRALHGRPLVIIDVSLRELASDDNLIDWYLKKSDEDWIELGIAIVNKHIVTLITVEKQKVLLGVQKIEGVLKGALYSRDHLHYPIYTVNNTSRYPFEKAS